MHFLPDVYVPCEQCQGKRYNRETLDVRFKGKTIADVLEMPVEEALRFFEHIPKVRRRLQTLHDVGLDYIRLGQPATTLSGGEAQRVKLATELSKVATGKTLYIKTADRLIDLGPEGGEEGGLIVAEGTPEQVAATPGSHTGRFLAGIVEPAAKPGRRRGGGSRKKLAAAA
jgi:excinuclease ABC subunit A